MLALISAIMQAHHARDNEHLLLTAIERQYIVYSNGIVMRAPCVNGSAMREEGSRCCKTACSTLKSDTSAISVW